MQKLARRPVRQAIEEFWSRFGALGTPKAFRGYKRLGGAALIGAPVAYTASKTKDLHDYLTNVDPDAPDVGLLDLPKAGRAPIGYDPEAVKKLGKKYLNDLLQAPYTEPGEQVVTASATDFLEKRAALQGIDKEAFFRQIGRGLKWLVSPTARHARRGRKAVEAATAAGLPLAEAQQVGAKAMAPASEGLMSKILSPGGLLVGGSLLGASQFMDPLAQRLGFEVREMPEKYRGITGLPERVRMDELMAEDFAKAVGKELGKATVGLAGDVLSKAVSIPGSIAGGMQRKNVLSELQAEDDVLAKADPTQVDEAYHTMVRFAPTLATDKNAVKTFLRESILYGTGPNFTTIKQLADAEGAVNRPPAVVVKR
jgi:hypothetical protein